MNPRKNKKQSQIIVEELQNRSRKVLEFAKKTMLAEKIEYKKLREALEHYVRNWNDFTHLGLFSMACEAVDGDLDTAVPVQAGMAMMAAAFDLHDDIIDKSEAKHGSPTVFGRFGKDITLLLGNAFLIEGFTLFEESITNLPARKMKQVLHVLKTSLFEIGNAHALELNLKKRTDAAPEEHMHVVEMKAASIEADMQIGAIVGGGTGREVEALARFGRIAGILGTLREEFIDVFESEELNQRFCSEYLPIPVLYAMQNIKLREKILKLFENEKIASQNVEGLADMVFEAKDVRKLQQKMKELAAESIQLASCVRNVQMRKQLSVLVSSALEDL